MNDTKMLLFEVDTSGTIAHPSETYYVFAESIADAIAKMSQAIDASWGAARREFGEQNIRSKPVVLRVKLFSSLVVL